MAEDLDSNYVYYAEEISVGGEDVTDLSAYATQRFNPQYDYSQENQTATIKNSFDPIARVSNDDGATWAYFDCLLTTDGYGTGAFDYANTLSGDVIIETLKETASDERYTMGSGVTFANNLSSVTLRTTQESYFNGDTTKFVSTITRGYTGGSLFTVENDSFTTQNITLDGGSKLTSAKACTSDGGLIYVGNGCTLNVNAGSTLQNSKVFEDGNETATLQGGAIYADENAIVNLTGAVFENCAANYEGGAIFGDRGSVITATGAATTFTSCSVVGWLNSESKSEGNGGAICANGNLTLTSTKFESCHSKRTGGAITVNNERASIVELNNCEIDNCWVTDTDGGGAFIYAAELKMSGGTITNCHAGWSGGGINIHNATATIDSISISGCYAPEGGGLLADENASVSITSGSITGCGTKTDGGVTTTTEKGGGVFIDGGATVNFSGTSSVSGNTATTNGGAIYVAQACP